MTTTEKVDPLVIASPTRLAQWLAPKLWGPKATFRTDPWILLSEKTIVREIMDDSQDSFVRINAPAQCGKSSFVEVFLPLWVLIHFPDTRIVMIAYSDEIAQRSGALVRDLIQLYGKNLGNIDVDTRYDAKGEFKLKGHQGGMLSVGIASGITGRPGDLIIVGDVIKNMKEAASRATKDLHWREWNGTVIPRLQGDTTVVMAATRWAVDDLSGRVGDELKDGGDRWLDLIFPAIAQPGPQEEVLCEEAWRDILDRPIGEPLLCRFSRKGNHTHPENWKDHHFYKIRDRKRVDPFTWASIYQQYPTSQTGGMFPEANWNYYSPDELPPLVVKGRMWDPASTEGGGDWTVGQLWGKSAEGNYYIIDQFRDRIGSARVVEQMKAHGRTDGVAVPIYIERERTGAGHSTFEFFQRALEKFTVRPLNPDGKKEDRWRPYSTVQQQGRVFLPRDTAWVPGFIQEHSYVMGDGRKGRYDDQVDPGSYAINTFSDESPTEMDTMQDLLLTGSGHRYPWQ